MCICTPSIRTPWCGKPGCEKPTAEILQFNGPTKLPIEPDKVLHGAVGELDKVLVIGLHKDGSAYYASSTSDGGDLLWMIEQLKTKLMNGDFQQ